MSRCSGCDQPAILTVDIGTATLCEVCLRRECIREYPPVDQRPWLSVSATRSTSKDDFAA